ncbi:MAG TPA: sialidase family protein, partial [Candidatus Deferrimicrobium sp.]|nr:sialidase family protein [Candidatus Deferrimicrobium sp.]
MRLAVGLLVIVSLVGSSLPVPGVTPTVRATDTTASGSWSVLGEYRVSPRPTSALDRSREPIVAAHPFDASRLAVVYPRGGEASTPVVRISHDGGKTWRTTASRPRGGGSHPMVAWGPGPRAGSPRLYYAAMGGSTGAYHWIVSYSDNEGLTWHQGFVADHTRGWFGGMADMVVDTNPASPNYGVLYLAYNWPKDAAHGDGLRVVASGDYGRTFAETEVPQLRGPTGYGDYWRIGYKLATAPDGSAYVAGYQLDMKVWLISSPFRKGGSANIGRIAFGVTRLRFDRALRRLSRGPNVLATTLPETAWNLGWVLQGVNVGLAEPCWATGLVVDAGGRIYYAVAGDGRIRILTSDDQGRTWRLRYLPQAPAANGRTQRSMRPDLVVGDGFVSVLFHTVDASGTARTAGNTMAVSFDRGATWEGPRAVNGRRWAIARIIARYNGPGLRDRGVLLADGRTIYFGYGDGRDGYSAAFGARVR